MSDTGFKYGNTQTNVNGGSNEQWTNMSYVEANDSNYCLNYVTSGNVSDYLQIKSFGFSVPSNAIIYGIEAVINRRTVIDSCYDNNIKLIKNGSVIGNNKASITAWASSFIDITYGGPSYLWGTTWTPSDINSSDFGISIQVRTTYSSTFYINYVFMKIHYMESWSHKICSVLLPSKVMNVNVVNINKICSIG